jgi:hypothetical protein
MHQTVITLISDVRLNRIIQRLLSFSRHDDLLSGCVKFHVELAALIKHRKFGLQNLSLMVREIMPAKQQITPRHRVNDSHVSSSTTLITPVSRRQRPHVSHDDATTQTNTGAPAVSNTVGASTTPTMPQTQAI